MPDIHWGYGFPIGGVAATDPDEGGVVSPGGVGYDINCGVRLVTTSDPAATRSREGPGPRDGALPRRPVRGRIARRDRQALEEGALEGVMTEGAAWVVRQKGFGTETDLEHTEERGRIAARRSRRR